MLQRITPRLLTHLIAAAVVAGACARPEAPPIETSTDYADLLTLFREWREFQPPRVVSGVPDYSAAAMAAQHRELARFQARLTAIDPTSWPVGHQVDHRLVRAEMSGLDFDHRVLRPWARNPAFYATVFPSQSDVPAREGPHAAGAIELWSMSFPPVPEEAARLRAQLTAIPPLLAQARANLTEDAGDLWVSGIGTMREQSADLAALAERAGSSDPELSGAIQVARQATDSFRAWLESEAPSKTGGSGVGIENYDWYLANVHLVPYTWSDAVAMMGRELARAHSALRLAEHRNRSLPPLAPVASAAEHERRFNAAVTDYMAFLRDREVVSIADYMDPALRARIGEFTPLSPDRPREFFTEVDYRDPVVMRTHGYHWFDLARMEREPHPSPIRRVPLLYNIFDGRAEGLATAMEEMMLHAGLFDPRPRARELIYVLLAQRAARALGDLMMHANRMTLREAVAFTSAWTPRGWLREDGATVSGEQHLYLQQPGYGISYLIGKIQIEGLLADRARQLGDRFTLKGFLDEVNQAGVIPLSLIRWELTGQSDEVGRPAAAR